MQRGFRIEHFEPAGKVGLGGNVGSIYVEFILGDFR